VLAGHARVAVLRAARRRRAERAVQAVAPARVRGVGPRVALFAGRSPGFVRVGACEPKKKNNNKNNNNNEKA